MSLENDAQHPSTELLFVYGTLQQGYPNEHEMRKEGTVEFVCAAETSSKFPLVTTKEYYRPWLLNRPGEGCNVTGEVYTMDKEAATYLDRFEGKDFTRTAIVVHSLENEGKTYECTAYLVNGDREAEWNHPYLATYPKEDALQHYVPPSKRPPKA